MDSKTLLNIYGVLGAALFAFAFSLFWLDDALHRAGRREIASFAATSMRKMTMRGDSTNAKRFLPFPDQPMKLLRPMVGVAALFR
ncbi:hypothetical protein [Bradyrhizobium sp. LTSP849]|uniref:hypothetical protein n=1 Tax=Bradyrhizobium sp. LTSP849 TaxID=1615890 RepID=UPI000A9CBD6A|nr:hypothetical protein [Bradyrhizobium sp. LTSP849]